MTGPWVHKGTFAPRSFTPGPSTCCGRSSATAEALADEISGGTWFVGAFANRLPIGIHGPNELPLQLATAG